MSETFNALLIGLLGRRCFGLAEVMFDSCVFFIAGRLVNISLLGVAFVNRPLWAVAEARNKFFLFQSSPLDTAEEFSRVSRSPLARR